jgi:transposase
MSRAKVRRSNRCRRCDRLDRRVRDLKAQNKKLHGLLEEARRAAKRQACPFSKGPPKRRPKKAGRKPGKAYGRRASRPKPRHVDEVLEAPLPARCPDCGGDFGARRVEPQWQHELPPVKPKVTQINVHVGVCTDCGKRVQGRHRRQTSNALGAAANQIGPTALALAGQLNKELGVPHGRIQMLFEHTFGLVIAKATIVRGIERVAARAEPLYANIAAIVRQSQASTWDETGWRIGGHRAWLWTGAAATATIYLIRRSRGFDVPVEVLGEDYRGGLVADGWSIYDRFRLALRQFCLQHPLRRCVELLETATRGAVRFPRDVKHWIEDALALRDRRDESQISPHGLAVAIGRLEARMHRMLFWTRANRANERFAKHLAAHEPFLLNFLRHPALDATNYRGEQALRPAVITRKISGGNRTDVGAHAQEVLTSFFRTSWQRDMDAIDLLVRVLCARTPAHVARLAFTDTG